MEKAMEAARRALREAERVAVLTGAGISAESGVPTFRGGGGFWGKYSAQELATPEGFAEDPRRAWEWYDWRRTQMTEIQPNPGHFALARLGERVKDFALITQNVDTLHEEAGSQDVLHLHGQIWMTRCLGCGEEREDRRAPLPELPPRCGCGGMLRPGVVWFGEDLPPGAYERAARAAARAEVFLVVGTSAQVFPAAGLIPFAAQSGAVVIEVNTEETDATSIVHHSLLGPSGEVLPRLTEL